MKPRSGGKEFEQVSQGMHPGICYQIIDLGQQQTEYQGQIKISAKIYLRWEIKDEETEDGAPLSIGKQYTNSYSSKSILSGDVKSWTGITMDGDFPYESLLGKPCNLNVTQEPKGEKTYANITAITPLMKGQILQPQHNPSVLLSLEPEEFDVTVFTGLSDWLKEKIAKSPEYGELKRLGYIDGKAPPKQGGISARPAMPPAPSHPDHPINEPFDPDIYGI